MTSGAAYARFLSRLEATRTLGVDFGLDRMQAALAKLGDPQRTLPAVHVAGTNGKGSTVAMVDAILRAAGRKTGLFTSPHLSRFTERIRIGGAEIDGDGLAAHGERVLATGVPLTYFEVATAAAFLAMAEAVVDLAILEVGLGGRLDATNVCQPLVTAITSIGLDHTDLLGDTLGAIAREKAGIAKPGVPMIVGPVPEEAAEAIRRVCTQAGAPISLVAPIVEAPDRERRLAHLPARLFGAHQADNAAIAVGLAEQVAAQQGFTLTETHIRAGLDAAVWPGRLELVVPGVLLDAAHNADGARALVAALPDGATRALVLSVVRGKAVGEMLGILAPHFDVICVTRSASARALPPAELVALVPAGARPRVYAIDDPMEALETARQEVGLHGPAGGLVVVAGSIFLIGEVRAALLGESRDPVLTGDPLP
ncbi:MAG TPA: folylpolyglutamate synthase/dihydrofolate synthase family protein [Polyangia bacterium]